MKTLAAPRQGSGPFDGAGAWSGALTWGAAYLSRLEPGCLDHPSMAGPRRCGLLESRLIRSHWKRLAQREDSQ